MKEAPKKLVIHREEGIGIHKVRKIINNGVLIEMKKNRGTETILKNKKMKATEMEVSLPAKKSPQIIIPIPRPTNDDEIKMEILKHKFRGEELNKLTKGSKVVFKTRDKKKDINNATLS